MIGPGWLPGKQRAGKRTLAYTRLRRRSRPRVNKGDPTARVANTQSVLFDHGPAEFPVAIVRPREPRGRAIALANDLRSWLAARWSWLRPRTIPCAFAALGMVAVIASANYLANQDVIATAPSLAHIALSAP